MADGHGQDFLGARAVHGHLLSRVPGQLYSRDEMYRPHLSHDGEVWEFTLTLIEEVWDGSMYDPAGWAHRKPARSWDVLASSTCPSGTESSNDHVGQ